ncbi:hypothetical protein SLS62_004567 [Diatrype stigma]|uniref:lytic cellulose monooxygenase (C4-dehydrogenating) n=1 Tax=Diatrype stigma TaxID=117547 RepID=A0AAN9UUG9_9PEZI
MRFTALSAAAALASTVSAHTTMFSVWVNGEDQGDGRNVYIRSPPNNNPVKELGSAAMACNVNGGTPVSDFVTAAAGDKLTFEWYHNSRGDDIIDLSHLGPIITYVAPYTEGDGSGAIWSKIDEEGYDGTTWAVQNLVANKGKKDFTLPASLAAGKYLVRQEVIGLHEADALYTTGRGAQFYPSCVQMEVTGSGSAVPDENFDIVTGYTADTPGVVFNLYGSFTTYPIPGPDVWSAASGSENAATPTSAAQSSAKATSAAPTTAAPTTAAPTTAAPTTAAPTTLVTKTKASTTAASPTTAAAAPTASAGTGVGTASLYGQCGGKNWTGATSCAAGTCTEMNPYYSQCVNA